MMVRICKEIEEENQTAPFKGLEKLNLQLDIFVILCRINTPRTVIDPLPENLKPDQNFRTFYDLENTR